MTNRLVIMLLIAATTLCGCAGLQPYVYYESVALREGDGFVRFFDPLTGHAYEVSFGHDGTRAERLFAVDRDGHLVPAMPLFGPRPQQGSYMGIPADD